MDSLAFSSVGDGLLDSMISLHACSVFILSASWIRAVGVLASQVCCHAVHSFDLSMLCLFNCNESWLRLDHMYKESSTRYSSA
jgi:hypothetical protein